MTAASAPRRVACRGCGRTLVFDDAKREIAHQVPECAYFQEVLAAAERRGIMHSGARIALLDEHGRELDRGKPS